MQRSRGNIVIILLLVLLGGISVTGYIWYQNQKYPEWKKQLDQTTSFENQRKGLYSTPSPTNGQSQGYIVAVANGKVEKVAGFPLSRGVFGAVAPVLTQDGLLIYLRSDGKLVKLNLRSGSQTELDFSPDAGMDVVHLGLTPSSELYLTESPKDYYGKNNGLIIKILDWAGNTTKKIGPHNTVTYGGLTYIGRLGGSEIFGSFGGDGCGGYGEIYRLSSGLEEKIAETGGGCVVKPQYLGFNKDTGEIELISVIPSVAKDKATAEPGHLSDYTSIYALDPTTKKARQIVNLLKINGTTRGVVIDIQGGRAGIYSSQGSPTSTYYLSVANLKTGNIDLVSKLSEPIPYNFWLTGNEVFTRDEAGTTLTQINLSTGDIQLSTLPASIKPVGNSPQFLGLWSGESVWYVETL